MAVDVSGIQDAVKRHAAERTAEMAERFVSVAQSRAPRRTGAGAASIAVESVSESSRGYSARIIVGETYMAYQNYGTGVYGPDGKPITPRNGTFLVFDSPILGVVFARSVRGTEPTHWWERTIDEWGRIAGGG